MIMIYWCRPLLPSIIRHQSLYHVPGLVNAVYGRLMMCRFLLVVVKATTFWDEAQSCISKIAGSFPTTAVVALSTIQPSSSTRIGLIKLQQFFKTHLYVVTMAPDFNSFKWTSDFKDGRMITIVPSEEKHAHDATSLKHCTWIGVPEEISHM